MSILKAAGRTINLKDESSQRCVQPNLYYNPPMTPDGIRKWRKTFKAGPGHKVIHPGQVNDVIPIDNFGTIKIKEKDFAIDKLIKNNDLSGLLEYKNNKQCEKYASNVREPLGKSFIRGHNLPNITKEIEFKGFGFPINPSEDAKNLLFTIGREEPNSFKDKQMQKFSHNTNDPGEQINRKQRWKSVDPNAFRFGIVEKNRMIDGTAKAMQNEHQEESFPKTKILLKSSEDHKNVVKDELGKSKNLGQQQYNSNIVHGKNKVKYEWNAGKCITGEATQRELEPDKGLSKAIKQGYRNDYFRKPEDLNRSFGIPSIRLDIPKKIRKSVADPNNQGDESNTQDLVKPKSQLTKGIQESDFTFRRNKSELVENFYDIGFDIDDDIWEEIVNKAEEMGYDKHHLNTRLVLDCLRNLNYLK